MQSEQQNVTNQSKKTSTGVKKEKKQISKTKESEVTVEKVLEEKPVVTQQTETVKTTTQTTTQTVDSNTEATIQDVEFNGILEYLNVAGDKLVEFSKYFKDNNLSKDERLKMENSFKKFTKSTSTLQMAYYEYLSKQISSLEKNSGNKSGGTKKVTDKEKSAIHKKHVVQPFLLNFMKLEPNTLVSRSDALTAITGYVKSEKIKNPDIIVDNDKMKFKLIGDLKPLFEGIEGVMKAKNLLTNNPMPSQIKYTQIMEFMTHCFIKQEETTVV